MATPGVTITPTTGTTSELGAKVTFRVVLNTQPSQNVDITFTSDNEAEGKPKVSVLTFTPANWNVAQSLVIEGVDDAPDDVFDGDMSYQVTGVVSSGDIDYIRGIEVPTLTLVNTDDPQDKPKVLIGDRDPNSTRDDMVGGNGNDTMSGGYDIDFLHGGRGADRLNGNDDDDQLYGQEHNDVLNGNNGMDLLDGGTGNDVLSGGEDDDSLDGGDGNDQMNGDNGYDLLQGAAGDDVLNGGNQDDDLQGGIGDDKLYGQEGDDKLIGNDGNDILDGGTGTDTMDGGRGSDTYYVDAAIMDIINDTGRDGSIDTVIVPAVNRYTLSSSIENGTVAGIGNGNLTGNTGGNTLTGNNGNNTLDGAGGNDVLNAGDGKDKVIGGAGTDVLDGGAGNDSVNGGSGSDRLVSSAGADTMVGGGDLDVADYSNTATAVNANLTTGRASGGSGNDILREVEILFGGSAGDTLTGNTQDNGLVGGTGNDVLRGGAGNDVVSGGSGSDILNGGDGADHFVYLSADATDEMDVIEDFSSAQGDLIDVHAIDADVNQEGIQHWTFAAAGFTGAAGEVTFLSDSEVVAFDMDGDGQADFTINLLGVVSLSAEDLNLG